MGYVDRLADLGVLYGAAAFPEREGGGTIQDLEQNQHLIDTHASIRHHTKSAELYKHGDG